MAHSCRRQRAQSELSGPVPEGNQRAKRVDRGAADHCGRRLFPEAKGDEPGENMGSIPVRLSELEGETFGIDVRDRRTSRHECWLGI
jgi:hypothetical protein